MLYKFVALIRMIYIEKLYYAHFILQRTFNPEVYATVIENLC